MAQNKSAVWGIYIIENKINNKKYIGCSNDVFRRWTTHRRELKTGKHTNSPLQRAYEKYGEENFSYTIIQETDKDNFEQLYLMEIYWISYYRCFIEDGFGYNLSRGGNGALNAKHSDESVKKRANKIRGSSNSSKGRKMSDRQKINIGNSNRGKPKSEEHKNSLRKPKNVVKILDNMIKSNEQLIQTGYNNKKRQYCFGVVKDSGTERWRAYIGINGKQCHIGYFKTKEDAISAYDSKAIELFGDNAITHEEVQFE